MRNAMLACDVSIHYGNENGRYVYQLKLADTPLLLSRRHFVTEFFEHHAQEY